MVTQTAGGGGDPGLPLGGVDAVLLGVALSGGDGANGEHPSTYSFDVTFSVDDQRYLVINARGAVLQFAKMIGSTVACFGELRAGRPVVLVDRATNQQCTGTVGESDTVSPSPAHPGDVGGNGDGRRHVSVGANASVDAFLQTPQILDAQDTGLVAPVDLLAAAQGVEAGHGSEPSPAASETSAGAVDGATRWAPLPNPDDTGVVPVVDPWDDAPPPGPSELDTGQYPAVSAPEPRRRRRWPIGTLLIILAALAVMAGIAYAVRHDTASTPARPDKTVPTVVGQPWLGAISELQNDGLQTKIEKAGNTNVAAGLVASQSPAAGQRVRLGTTVVLDVSGGPSG